MLQCHTIGMATTPLTEVLGLLELMDVADHEVEDKRPSKFTSVRPVSMWCSQLASKSH